MEYLRAILERGVKILTLEPEELLEGEVDSLDLARAVQNLSRKEKESAKKAESVRASWEKRRAATEKWETDKMPAWVTRRKSRYIVSDLARMTIRRVFQLSIDGMGHSRIASVLNSERLSPFSSSDCWTGNMVRQLLQNRAVLGEHQPCRMDGRKRIPTGPKLLDRWPKVIEHDMFQQAQSALNSRRGSGGRPIGRKGDPGFVNLFAGLLKNPDGKLLYLKTHGGRRLIRAHGAKTVGFPMDVVETAILRTMRHISPKSLLEGRNKLDFEIEKLDARVGEIETRLAEIESEIVIDNVAVLTNEARRLRDELTSVQERLQAAKLQASKNSPSIISSTWSLVNSLSDASDPLASRYRLKTVLKTILHGIVCQFKQVNDLKGVTSIEADIEIQVAEDPNWCNWMDELHQKHGLLEKLGPYPRFRLLRVYASVPADSEPTQAKPKIWWDQETLQQSEGQLLDGNPGGWLLFEDEFAKGEDGELNRENLLYFMDETMATMAFQRGEITQAEFETWHAEEAARQQEKRMAQSKIADLSTLSNEKLQAMLDAREITLEEFESAKRQSNIPF